MLIGMNFHYTPCKTESTLKVFCSITFITCVRFCSNLHHTLTIRECMFNRKIGAEGSVLQDLCLCVILMIRCIIIPPAKRSFIIPPAKRSLWGVYCFQHVRDSIILKFRLHLMILLYNFDSFCPILFRFTPYHNHQTMHVWQKNRGVKGQYYESYATL